MSPYFYIIISWLLFGGLHSILASNPVKRRLGRRMGKSYQYYRLVYNLVAFGTFWMVMESHRNAPGHYMWPPDSGGRLVGTIAMVVGLAVVWLAIRQYDLREFSGLDVIWKSPPTYELRQGGILGYVRHPLYSGTILLALALLFMHPTISHCLFAVFTTLYIRVGIYFEEKKLIRTFGNTYRRYQKRVPMLWPQTGKISIRQRGI